VGVQEKQTFFIRNPSSRARSARRILFCPYGERSEPIKRMGVLLFSLLAGCCCCCWGLSTAVTKPTMIKIQKITWIIFLALWKKPFFCFWIKFFFKKEKTCKFGHFWPFFGVCQAQRIFFIYLLENLYTDSSHHPTDPFFSVFQKKKFFLEKWL